MSKGSFFIGQPVFSQVLNLISKSEVHKSAKHFSSDHYCKKFKTYDHLTEMLYAIFNRCSSIREVVTGIMACHSKLLHLGVSYTIRRSTLSDANKRRTSEVFEDIYNKLYARYRKSLSDSRSKRLMGKVFIVDSTTISLFQEILKGVGPNPVNGRRKGGIKAHTLMKVDEDIPQMIRFTAGAAHDVTFMKKVSVPRGSILVFDKAYRDYSQLHRWDSEGVFWVTRIREDAVSELVSENDISDAHSKRGILSDRIVCIGHSHNNRVTKVRCRIVKYYHKETKKTFEFVTNNFLYSPLTITQLYKQRWQIETLFKRIKQNYPLRNFLGDNENAIKVQIWCALIADLLLKVIQMRTQKPWSFANLASMVRLHLMTYINLLSFLNKPEQTLLRTIPKFDKRMSPQLFPT